MVYCVRSSRAPVRLVDLLLDDLVLERPVGKRVDGVEIHVVVGEERSSACRARACSSPASRPTHSTAAATRRTARSGRRASAPAARRWSATSTCRPRCRRDAPASNRSGGRGRCRGPCCFPFSFCFTLARSDLFRLLPLAPSGSIASLTDGAVDDLLGRDRERRRRLRRARANASKRGADDVELFGLPGLQRPLDRLELAGAEQPRAPLLGRARRRRG